MINLNKTKNKKIFPQLKKPIQHQVIENKIKNIKLSSVRNYQLEQLKVKQNTKPKDIFGSTVYLQFPIGKKNKRKNSQIRQNNVTKTDDQNGYEIDVFLNRGLCAMYKKDVRARMLKYNQQRLSFMSDRSHYQKDSNNKHKLLKCKISNISNLGQIRKQYENLDCFKKNLKIMRQFGDIVENNQKVTRWDNVNKSVQQSNDSFLEELVQLSKHQKNNF